MHKFAKHASRFLASDSGATAVEYAVVLALIAGACIFAIAAVGVATNDHATTSKNALESALN